jgi:peptidoglycan/LPS O-acetylase OafA/YrhL
LKYRAEIDGLRALAVLPVILFHAGFELFSGGFVGVDVFFVISGYLITTILIEDIENKRFSIVNFYERRARRILPALFCVMLVCIPFAWIWMLPSQMKDFSQSLVAVSLFASNILFWRQSGYFDAAAEEKPLLHTWSLAVEEQYYVIFPIFLILTWRFGKNRVFWMIVVMAAISLLLSEWGWRNKASANFYLAPTRAWELFAGSVAAFIVQKQGVQKNNLLALVGLAAIIFSIFFYDETTPFPSVYALVPVIGVVLLVLYAEKDTFAAKVLSTKGFVGIGLISYSAYLWHQPLFAFARIRGVNEPSNLVMGLLAVSSLIFAYFSWRLIETPFRSIKFISKKGVFFASICGIAIFFVLGLSFSELKPTRLVAQFYSDAVVEEQRVRRFETRQEICNKKTWAKCDDAEDGKINVLIIGDSHSADASTAIVRASERIQNQISISSSALGGCSALKNTQDKLPSTWPNKSECVYLNENQRYNIDFLDDYDVLVVNFLISNHWNVDDFIQYLRFLDDNFTGHVIAFGGAFSFEEELPSFFNRGNSVEGIDSIIINDPYSDDDQIRRVEFEKVMFLSKYDVFCPRNECSFVTMDGRLMTYDKHHLSVEFARLLGDAYANQITNVLTRSHHAN